MSSSLTAVDYDYYFDVYFGVVDGANDEYLVGTKRFDASDGDAVAVKRRTKNGPKPN